MTATEDRADRRQAWARPYIRKAPDAPVYGSPEWLALPDGPEKVAAVVKAAECWLTEAEDGLERLRAEHMGAWLEAKAAEDAEHADRRDRHRTAWDVSWRRHPANQRGAA